jgi:hypothetical protein
MIYRKNKYYFMWSEGGWGGPDYSVAYAMADNPTGPFKRIGKILQQDMHVATGAGHHSVLHIPGTDDYYIVYHRRPLGETDPNHRVVCIDKMEFDANGLIKPVTITKDGVGPRPLSSPNARDIFVSAPFNPIFDRKALDILRGSPKWLPAIEHNRRVSSRIRIPISFNEPG